MLEVDPTPASFIAVTLEHWLWVAVPDQLLSLTLSRYGRNPYMTSPDTDQPLIYSHSLPMPFKNALETLQLT